MRQAWRLAGQNWGAGSAQTVPRLSKGGLHATLRCKKKTPSPPPPLLRVHQALDLPYHAPPTTAALVFSLRNAELKSYLRLRIRCWGAEISAPSGTRESFFTGGYVCWNGTQERPGIPLICCPQADRPSVSVSKIFSLYKVHFAKWINHAGVLKGQNPLRCSLASPVG